MVRKADLHRIEHLVECIVYTDDLDVFKDRDETLHLSIAFERVEKGTISVWCQLE